MRQPHSLSDAFGSPAPHIDDISFKSLYRKQTYEITTGDRWTLVVTRYKPVRQPFPQPIFGEPMLLVHGFSQNRHAWTCGDFVKHMLYYGADIHILELRGHGKSSVALQEERVAESGGKLPDDIDYDWDIDSFFLYDIPAAVAAVKRMTRRDKIFYCGHSMGGMLGYGYAGISSDLAGLITIGAACDPGKGFLPLRVAAHLAPFERIIDTMLEAEYGLARIRHAAESAVKGSWSRLRALVRRAQENVATPAPARKRFRYYPVDRLFHSFEWALSNRYTSQAIDRIGRHYYLLAKPGGITADDLRWILREGGEKETRKVVNQCARWIRSGELKCYRTGYDFKANFSKLSLPMAIIFGDLDPLASVRSTQAIYRAATSDYLLWRPVKGNSHLELTMGRDIRQICFDIKNLIEYAGKYSGGQMSTAADMLRG